VQTRRLCPRCWIDFIIHHNLDRLSYLIEDLGEKTIVKLTFYGGVNEIGGNMILLEDKDTKIFLDFGMSFSFGVEYFTGFLQPRRVNGLGDYFEFDL